MGDAELEAAYRRLMVELTLEQAARPVPRRDIPEHRAATYGLPVTVAQANRNWAVLEAATGKPRRRGTEEET